MRVEAGRRYGVPRIRWGGGDSYRRRGDKPPPYGCSEAHSACPVYPSVGFAASSPCRGSRGGKRKAPGVGVYSVGDVGMEYLVDTNVIHKVAYLNIWRGSRMVLYWLAPIWGVRAENCALGYMAQAKNIWGGI